jgi:Fic family protein
MDPKLFSEKSPGQLSEILVQGTNDWAFIPAPLPLTWEISNDVWELLAQAREELARLDGIGRVMPNYNLLLRPLQQREALTSSSLEGTYATPEQLFLFEIDPKEPKSANSPESSWQEVANYGKALNLGLQILDEQPISLNMIRQMHQQLLAGVRGANKAPGSFRPTQVHIGSDRRFIPPPPHEVTPCLYDLESAIRQNKTINPLIFCFMAHYQFEAIHPFLDGNGRVGRLLLSLMIYQQCNLKHPWLYLSAFFEKYKDEYIDLLFNVSKNGDWSGWIKFCLRATIEQSSDSIRRFDKLLELRSQYIEQINVVGGSIRLNRLIDYLFEQSPAITVAQAIELCGSTDPTARADIERLINAGILVVSTITKRPKIFIAPAIFKTIFED